MPESPIVSTPVASMSQTLAQRVINTIIFSAVFKLLYQIDEVFRWISWHQLESKRNPFMKQSSTPEPRATGADIFEAVKSRVDKRDGTWYL
jgi:hypothetical protein